MLELWSFDHLPTTLLSLDMRIRRCWHKIWIKIEDRQNFEAFIADNNEGNVQSIDDNAVPNKQNTQNIIINDFQCTQSCKTFSNFWTLIIRYIVHHGHNAGSQDYQNMPRLATYIPSWQHVKDDKVGMVWPVWSNMITTTRNICQPYWMILQKKGCDRFTKALRFSSSC